MKYCFLFFLSTLSLFVTAQQLKLTNAQVEAMFLEQNLELIAERMNVPIADAAIAQAKVWDNPELSIDDINFWGGSEHPKQFAVELKQMISLSARRAKLAGVEKIGREIAIAEFEELLRALRVELRSTLASIRYNADVIIFMDRQKELLNRVVSGYMLQYEQGNVTRGELVRLQTALLVLEGEMNDTRVELNGDIKTIKNLLSIDSELEIITSEAQATLPDPSSLNLEELIQLALDVRPSLQKAKLRSEQNRREITYQKALVIPDLSVGVKYDRRAGLWNDYISMGVGFNVPIFNHNKGEITKSRIQLRQNEILMRQEQNAVRNEIIENFDNYCRTYSLLEGNLSIATFNELDILLDVYAKNLLGKNITMVEYMDFMDSYRSTKQMILRSRKELVLQFEQLQFAVGQWKTTSKESNAPI